MRPKANQRACDVSLAQRGASIVSYAADRERMLAMAIDDVMIGIVVGGIGLSGAYIRAEYVSWREHRAAERRNGVTARELHAARLSRLHDDKLAPTVAQLQTFAEANAPIAEDIADSEIARRTARSSSQRSHPNAERRARPRHHATT
jgi:hypothetical protein